MRVGTGVAAWPQVGLGRFVPEPRLSGLSALFSANGRLFFHPETSIWLGFVVNVGPGGAGLGPYCVQKIEKRGKEDLLVVLELF